MIDLRSAEAEGETEQGMNTHEEASHASHRSNRTYDGL
jgi:hypothetical protein